MFVPSRIVLSVVAACVAVVALTACGSNSDTPAGPDPATDPGTTTPGASSVDDPGTDADNGAADDDPGTDADDGAADNIAADDGTSGSGTFTVTGDIQMSGTLTDVICIESNPDNYVAQGNADTARGEVTVGAEIPSPHPEGDQQEGNSLLVGDTLYNRTSMGSKPLSGSRDGEMLTVTAQLVNIHDPFDPALVDDHDQWRTVTVTSHWDCGGQLAKWDAAESRMSALGMIGGDSQDRPASTGTAASSATSTATSPTTPTTTQSSTESPSAAAVRLPAPTSGSHTVKLSGEVDKTLELPTVVCTGDVLSALGPDGSGVTIGVTGPTVMVHIVGSPEVWRAGEHADSAGPQAKTVDFPPSGTVTPYPGGVALSKVTLARADSAMAAPDPSTTATATGSLACTVGTLTTA